MSSLKEDTLSIKSIMTKMYQAFKGQSSSAPSSSVTSTLALTHIPINIEGEDKPNTTTEDPSSLIERETDANKKEKPEEPKHSTNANIKFIEGKGIANDEQVEDQRKLDKASSIVLPDPDALVLVPCIINEKLHYLTAEQIEAHMDKEEKIKKAKEEARLLAISKHEDTEHEVLKRKHTKKVRKSLELRKHKYDNYMWTINSRLKLEKITDIKIHPKTQPVVIIVYRGTDGRTFDVHNTFAFGDFGRRYERIKKIHEELEIPSTLPAPIPE
ncbi:hypothetical protein Tco_0744925 [Tanacetum coccineum]